MYSENDPIDLLVVISSELTQQRPELKAYLHRMIKAGRLSIEVNPEEEETYTDIDVVDGMPVYTIQLGTLPHSEKITERIMFDSGQFSQEELIQYRLLHEISHTVVNELMAEENRDMRSLLSVCEGEHKRDKKYFTGLASFKDHVTENDPLYELPEDRDGVPIHEEDATELLTMGLWSSEYLRSYVNAMIDPEMEAQMKRVRVRKISPETAAALYLLIKKLAKLSPQGRS